MKKNITKIIIFIMLLIVLAATPIICNRIENKRAQQAPPPPVSQDFLKKSLDSNTQITKDELPNEIFIKVPFIIQAPFANWDALHEEACEEASLIMMAHFIKKTPFGDQSQWEKEIQDLVKWETDHGYKQDVTMKELSQIAKDYYGLNATAKYDITLDDIKTELATGRPVITPAAGKILPNPNFRNGGPNYHNLVVTGYDYQGFITNDPGTRNGQNFRYTYDSLFNAIHDYNSDNMFYGPKAYLVFE